MLGAQEEEFVIPPPADVPAPPRLPGEEQLSDKEWEFFRKAKGLDPPSRMLLGDAAREVRRLAEINLILRELDIKVPDEPLPPEPEKS